MIISPTSAIISFFAINGAYFGIQVFLLLAFLFHRPTRPNTQKIPNFEGNPIKDPKDLFLVLRIIATWMIGIISSAPFMQATQKCVEFCFGRMPTEASWIDTYLVFISSVLITIVFAFAIMSYTHRKESG